MANVPQNLERLPKKDLQSIFSELSERDLRSLYTFSEIRALATGEVLIREGDTGHTVYVILNGEFKIVKDTNGQPREIAILRSGDWVGEIAFKKKIPQTASAVATVPSSVMAINEATLNALTVETQLFFLKKLNDLANERNRQLISRRKGTEQPE